MVPRVALVVAVALSAAAQSRYWCPMHPDERAATPASCPICRMAMVPIPPMRVGEYRMDLSLEPGRGGRGASGLSIVILDPVTGAPVQAFETVHERPLHVFLVSRDLRSFAHVHPEPAAGGVFHLRHALPAGEYMLVADFVPAGGAPQTLQRAIVTPGARASTATRTPAMAVASSEIVMAGVRVRLDPVTVPAGTPTHVTFTFTDARTGAPLTDLEPYLGAMAHVLLVNADLTQAQHGHPEDMGPGAQPSTATFDLTLPTPGPYKAWVQVQRRGKVLTGALTIEAR